MSENGEILKNIFTLRLLRSAFFLSFQHDVPPVRLPGCRHHFGIAVADCSNCWLSAKSNNMPGLLPVDLSQNIKEISTMDFIWIFECIRLGQLLENEYISL